MKYIRKIFARIPFFLFLFWHLISWWTLPAHKLQWTICCETTEMPSFRKLPLWADVFRGYSS